MRKLTVEKFGLCAIRDVLTKFDLAGARNALSLAVDANLDVSRKVQKVAQRDEQCKLVIESGDAAGFVVFADCLPDAENVKRPQIRKGSLVSVRGKLEAFGASAVNLIGCRLR